VSRPTGKPKSISDVDAPLRPLKIRGAKSAIRQPDQADPGRAVRPRKI
jgi:hypothetical protein